MPYNAEEAKAYIEKVFEESLIKSLSDFITIPNLSRGYDEHYATNGLLEKAANHIRDWVLQLGISGLTSEIITHPGYTPILFTQITGQIDRTIFFYGHYDKQPHMDGWHQGKSATKPVIENDKLYGRGGADDGYSTYCSMLVVKALQLQGLPLPRIVMITEGDEETGGHIQYYLEALKDKIGNPEIIFCLDSGTFDYQRFWLTNSLRGYIGGVLKIQTIKQGVHSGESSGIVPSCFKIADLLVRRLENVHTGKVHPHFTVDIPIDRYDQTYKLVELGGVSKCNQFPNTKGLKFVTENPLELLLNRTWAPQLTVTGITGLPEENVAGNVMVPSLELKLSLRVPPNLNLEEAQKFLHQLLTKNPPFGAHVTFENVIAGAGFNSPTYEKWLKETIHEASIKAYGKEPAAMGEGGSIPFMGLLASFWPKAQFVITGVLGPESNAHGPNEFLHIPYTKKLTYAMAHIVAKAAEHFGQ